MKISVNIELTWSKIMALIILVLAFIMDFANDKGGTVFMFSIPFANILITGKQYFDKSKTVENG